MSNLLESDKNLNLDTLRVPTSIIWGENDTVTPVSDGLHMKNIIPNATCHIIPNARHAPQFTHVSEVVKCVQRAIHG